MVKYMFVIRLTNIYNDVILKKTSERRSMQNMIKTYVKLSGKYLLIFIITIICLWGMLYFGTLIPNDSIKENYISTAYNYSGKQPFEFKDESKKMSGVIDNYADTIWLNIAWNMGDGRGIKSTLLTNYYKDPQYGEAAGLYYTVTEGKEPNTNYTRYWHGNGAVIRFMHLFTDVNGIKMAGLLTVVGLALLTVIILLKRKHIIPAIFLVVSLLIVKIWNIGLSLEYQPSFVIAFILTPIYLISERKSNEFLAVLSIIGGCMVAFFDFLTTETVTILLPLAIVVTVRSKENRLASAKENVMLIFKCLILWAVSYVMTFIIKWIFAEIVSGGDSMASSFESAAVHMLGGGSEHINSLNRPSNIFSSLFANFSVIFGSSQRVEPVFAFVGLTIVLACVLYVALNAKNTSDKTGAPMIVLSFGLFVLLRFFVLNNHSYVHEFFVYRALVTTIFTLLSSLWLLKGMQRKRRHR